MLGHASSCTTHDRERGCACAQANELGANELQMQAWGDSVQKMYSVALDLFGIDPKLVVVSSRRKQGMTRGSFSAHRRACSAQKCVC